MKNILILLLFGFSLCYNPEAAVKYARNYCQHYNPKYQNYVGRGGDCANFVSQCMIAGGMSFSDCNPRRNGILSGTKALRDCLTKKGWKYSITKPRNFIAGYPMAKTDFSHFIIATHVNGNLVKFCGHTSDVCDGPLKGSVYYFYPQ